MSRRSSTSVGLANTEPFSDSGRKTFGGKHAWGLAAGLVACAVVVAGSFNLTSPEPAHGAGPDDLVITSYGATANDSTDDSAAVQAAVNAAQTGGGGVVWIPEGRFQINTTVVITGSNVTVEGTGAGSILYSPSAGGTVLKIGNTGTDDDTSKNGTKNNRVFNLAIDRSVARSTSSIGILVERAIYTDIDGVFVYNAGVGIVVGPNCGQCELKIPNQFTNIRNTNILRSGSILATNSATLVGISFRSGADHKLTSVFVEPGDRGVEMLGRSNGISVSQLTVVNGAPFNYGVVMAGTGFARIITNSIFENAHHQQIYIAESSNNVTVADSWVGAGDLVSNRIGIQIDPGAANVLIQGNRIGDQRSHGILSRGSSVSIVDNQLDGNVNSQQGSTKTLDSIQIEGGRDVTVSGNRVATGGGRCGIGLYNNGAAILDDLIVTENNITEVAGADPCVGAGIGANRIISNNLG